MLKILFIGLFIVILEGCQSAPKKVMPVDFPPVDPNPPAPNCAADGPGCQQFNPSKP